MAGATIRSRNDATAAQPVRVRGAATSRADAGALTAPLVVAAVITGWALRAFLLDAWPLREDEAIYGVWARSAWADPWFLSIWPDKPPLFIWLQAVALWLLGATPAAARFVSLAGSTATIPLAAWIAQRVGGRRAALFAAWLMALSPFAISFAATAYTDSLLVFLGMLSLALALRGQPLAVGLALGATFMTKQQGLLYVPLVAAALWIATPARRGRALWRLLGGVLLVAAPILLWDALRWGSAPSPWDLGVRNYGPLALAQPTAWIERLSAWGQVAWHLGASRWAWFALAVLLAAGLISLHRRPFTATASRLYWLLLLWSIAFALLHLFSTAPAWDRYLLPLAPMLAILVAAPAARINLPAAKGRLPAAKGRLPAAVIATGVGTLLLLAAPAWTAARGGLPVGADHGAYAGLDETMAWLRDHAAERPIVYTRVLGWQANYALFDEVRRGDVELRWFPSAVYLADNAAKAPHRTRYVVEPAWAQERGVRPALAARRLQEERHIAIGQIGLWEISSLPQPACAWCQCRRPAWPTLASDEPPAMSARP